MVIDFSREQKEKRIETTKKKKWAKFVPQLLLPLSLIALSLFLTKQIS